MKERKVPTVEDLMEQILFLSLFKEEIKAFMEDPDPEYVGSVTCRPPRR